MIGRMLRAATDYGLTARRLRRAGLNPLAGEPGRQASARLIAAVRRFHQDWTEFRSDQGHPLRTAVQPLPPPRTPEGAVIRAAKALGHAISGAEATRTERAALLRNMTDASERLARRPSKDKTDDESEPHPHT